MFDSLSVTQFISHLTYYIHSILSQTRTGQGVVAHMGNRELADDITSFIKKTQFGRQD